MKRLCTICARGGSKGVKNKNLRDLAGRPLLAWSIAQARESRLFEAVAVSSDSEDILRAAREWGADLAVKRPDALATDEAPKVPAIRHAALEAMKQLGLEAGTLVDLSATAPLRSPEDIAGAVRLQESTGATSVITGMRARCSPYFSLVEVRPDGTAGLSKPGLNLARRQDAPACFDMNGSIYVWAMERFLEAPSVFYPDTRLYEMPEERSIDIDTELDFRIAAFLMSDAARV